MVRWIRQDLPRTSVVSLGRTLRLATSPRFADKNKNSSFISACKVIRNGSSMEIFCFVSGCILAVVNGTCGWPILLYFCAYFAQDVSDILGKVELTSRISAANGSQEIVSHRSNFSVEVEWRNAITNFTVPATVAGIICLFTGYLFCLILNATAERIVLRLKKLYFKKLLEQNMSWFDTKTQGELILSISKSSGLVQAALGDKLGVFISSVSNVALGFVICLCSGWKLTLAMSVVYPILILASKLCNKYQEKSLNTVKILNGDLAELVQEVVGAVKTVFAFGGEQVEINRLTNRLRVSRKMNIRQGVTSGINFTLVLLVMVFFIIFGIWYGIKLMLYDDGAGSYRVRHVFLVVFVYTFSGLFTRQAASLYVILDLGFRAANDMINVIENDQEIDNSNRGGKIIHKLSGNIELNKVLFQFQSTDENTVVQSLSLNIKAGETVALVGPSGGGKSTILQLILRFYDPQEGQILIDGIPLRKLNVGWFRSKVGVVNQEPHLFNTTIRENIQYGMESASDEEIIAVAKAVNAHDFILNLPQQYDTVAGEQGCLLSGGQRQRIALARALIRNPAILLLDEATSALDSENEKKILDYLTGASCGRTVIMIAHRLSTVRTVDRIVGIKDGQVVEQGTHQELVVKKGLYYQLLQAREEKGQQDEENAYSERRCSNKLKHRRSTNGYDLAGSTSLMGKDSDSLLESKTEMRKSFLAMLELCSSDVFIFVGIACSALVYVFCLIARPFMAVNLINLIVKKNYYDHGHGFAVWAGFYILSAICTSVSFLIKLWLQSMAEENLLVRIRQRALATILQQDVGWFDETSQNVGNLCSLMMMDAENVKKIPGAILGSWFFTSLAFTMMVAFCLWFQWKLTLAVGAMSIGIFISYYAKEKFDREILQQKNNADALANDLAVEAIRCIPTVVSQHIQRLISDKYNRLLGQTNGFCDLLRHNRAFAVASADAVCLLGIVLGTSFGGYLMSCNQIDYVGFHTINFVLVNNMWEVIIAFSAIPSYSKACVSAKKFVELFARKPSTYNSKSAGIYSLAAIKPKIEFSDVCFSYPTRPDDKILNHLNLVIENGENVAFVGANGCGKTTCLQLLQRFYDPNDGKVTLNGVDIRALNVSFLRSLIGYVSQEPVLFSRTIGENIAYGNNERKVEMHEIIDAARKANIHEFITTLQQGYDTLIGARGVELSGGQKQRVAIARALVRNPQILLLDEATSALDNESQKAVQHSLEKAQEGRTCIVIAHRLSTIQNVQKIVVISHGKIVEAGTPHQLLANKGFYYELLHSQSDTQLF